MIRGDGEKPGNAAVRRLFMTTMRDLEKKLRKLDYHQARLYLFCNFISLMLITAYSIMMMAPTVLEVLPEGGDSRKQMVAIFVLAAVGCGEYASVEEAAAKLVKVVDTVEPDPELTAKYEARYQQFKEIYPACKPLFDIIKN